MATLYRVNVEGGWSTSVQADSEYEAKKKALEALRLAGHSLLLPYKKGNETIEPYILSNDGEERDGVKRKCNVHAMPAGGTR